MFAVFVLIAGLLVPGVVLANDQPTLPAPDSDLRARDSWIVVLAGGVSPAEAAPELAKAAGGQLGHVYTHALSGFQLLGSASAAAALQHNPSVKYVWADHAVHLTETLPFGVERVGAYSSSGGAYQAGYRGDGARIAILDTGIDLDHPDLAASLDIGLGVNCVNPLQPPDDGYGHGTHTAGTAAAPLNGVGVVGVAPEARLVPVKIFDDSGNTSEAVVLCGLDHIVDLNTDADATNDIDVANMSWGEQRTWGDCASDPLHEAICSAYAANIIMAAGAGNSAVNAGNFVPAAYVETFSISALADFDGKPGGLAGCGLVPALLWIECDDTMAFFSNYGASVDFIAPGVNVYSTWANGGYQTENGTSMATPHVTGVVALMAAANPELTASEALAALRLTGECPNGQAANADGTPGCAGQGTWPDDPDGIPEVLPNALRAVQAVAGGAPPPPPPPPEPKEPGAPTLNAATGGPDSITLSWSAPASDGGDPITGYQVWRGESSGGEVLLTTVGVQSSYVDGSVVSGTTYWYQVAAVNGIGPGARSNELSASTISPPSAPTLLGAPADATAVLSWTVPADDGGGAITAYNVYQSVDGGPEALLDTVSAAETTYIDMDLTNGTPYTYRVAALNVAGQGAYSNPVTVTPTGSATAPGAPQALEVSKTPGSFALTVSWSAPASDGGSPVATYFIYRRAEGDVSFTFTGSTPNGTTTTYADVTVERRTNYTYYVTAWNAYGEGPASPQVTARSK